MKADRYWFLTWTTYGTWLPGDSRGFVSTVVEGDGPRVRHNTPGTPCDENIPKLKEAAQSQLKQPPVWLTREQSQALEGQFFETARYRCWQLLGLAIMSNHVHLLVGVPEDPDPDFVMGSFKSYGSRCLNRLVVKKQEWWTESGSKRRIREAERLPQALRYIQDQQRPLVVWVDPEWVPTIETGQGERGA